MKPRVRDEAPAAEEFARLQAALERKPEVAPPVDFARRVVVRAAALPQRRRAGMIPYGRVAALIASVLMAVALFALASRTPANFHSVGFDVELLVLLLLGVLGWWIGRQPSPGR